MSGGSEWGAPVSDCFAEDRSSQYGTSSVAHARALAASDRWELNFSSECSVEGLDAEELRRLVTRQGLCIELMGADVPNAAAKNRRHAVLDGGTLAARGMH